MYIIFFTLGNHIDNSIVGFNCNFFQFFGSSVLDGMRHPVNSRVKAQCICLNCCSILKFCCHQKDSGDSQPIQFVQIVQTARCTGSSICKSLNNYICFLGHVIDHLLWCCLGISGFSCMQSSEAILGQNFV